MKKYVSNFHYLTTETPSHSHLQLAQMACEAGLKWIQYRCFDKSLEEKIEEVNAIADICDDWGSTLVICQDIELAKHAKDYQGLHIENDALLSIEEAREVIGEDRVLGLSCPNIQKLLSLKDANVDYFSIGPYNHTETIQSSNPILKECGLIDSMEAILSMAPNFPKPIIVAGGISLDDIAPIFRAGAQGLAVCSAINSDINPKEMMQLFYKEILASSKN